MEDIVAFVFARSGSKGVPRKNIRLFCGKPLIGWSIEQALAVRDIQRVIVSTDSEEIASIAKKFGAEVPFIRPKELAQDDSPEWMVWKHALQHLKNNEGKLPEVMISVPATAPLRMPVDIENCLKLFMKGKADVVVSVTEAHRNPWFNMVKVRRGNEMELVIPPTEGLINRRQDAPIIYDMATVAYVVDPSYVLLNDSLFSGRVHAEKIPVERSIDIDTMYDFEIAEYLMRKRLESL